MKLSDEVLPRAETFAKYHDEHARYGGASQEFHMRASSYLRSLEADRDRWRDHAQRVEREREFARIGLREVAAALGYAEGATFEVMVLAVHHARAEADRLAIVANAAIYTVRMVREALALRPDSDSEPESTKAWRRAVTVLGAVKVWE